MPVVNMNVTHQQYSLAANWSFLINTGTLESCRGAAAALSQ